MFGRLDEPEREALKACEMVTRILGDLVRGGYVRIEDQRMILQGRLPSAW